MDQERAAAGAGAGAGAAAGRAGREERQGHKFRAGAHAVLAAYRMHKLYAAKAQADPSKRKKHEFTKLAQAQRLLAFAKGLHARLEADSVLLTEMNQDLFDAICEHLDVQSYNPCADDEEMGAMAMMQGLGF